MNSPHFAVQCLKLLLDPIEQLRARFSGDNHTAVWRQDHVEYLDTQQLIARAQKLKKEFSVLKIQPVTNASIILISIYWASYKKSKLNLGLSDWSEVRLLYNCEKQTFTVSKVRLGGV